MEVKTISEQLSLQPNSSHDVGDLRVTKHGRLLGGIYEDMRWSLDLCDGNRLDAEAVLFEDFISLKNHSIYLRLMLSDGTRSKAFSADTIQ